MNKELPRTDKSLDGSISLFAKVRELTAFGAKSVATSVEILRETQAWLLRERLLRRSAEESEARIRQELAAEIATTKRFHQLVAELLAQSELQPLLEEVLTAVIELQDAHFGNIQVYNRTTSSLRIVAHRGFNPDFLQHFRDCQDETTTCGRALIHRERVLVENIRNDPQFASHRTAAEAAGFCAVQSTPLLSRRGKVLGVISTHFPDPHRPSDRELRFTHLYACIAAEMMEHQLPDDASIVSPRLRLDRIG